MSAMWWRDHSLSLVFIAAGFACYGVGYTIEGARLSDFVLNFGHGLVPMGLYGLSAGRLREANQPEAPPH